ncbi:ATP-binding protein [Sphaerisporangium rhizosphaerae]|uniref:ATP-binding protein n=1 Tax=Sphaerisporangium rhizosphaerae TaxID=2269375 RepID=A0ABW2NYE2_9ACTN
MTCTNLSDHDRLVLLTAAYAELLAHARAAVAAAEQGESDPIGYVRDVLVEHGQLPPAGVRPARLLATLPKATEPMTPTCQYERMFAGCPEAIAEVRRYVETCLTGVPRRDEAVLCASELASNAVRHSASGLDDGKFTVRVSYGGHAWARIEVADAGEPSERPPLSRGVEGGRGLAIVAALARCGAEPLDIDGKQGRLTWCELDWPADHYSKGEDR